MTTPITNTVLVPAEHIDVAVKFTLPELYRIAEVLFEEEQYGYAAMFYKECAKAGLSNGIYSLTHLYQHDFGVTAEDLEKATQEFLNARVKAEPITDYELEQIVEG